MADPHCEVRTPQLRQWPAGLAQALASALVKILRMPDLGHEMGQAGRELAAKKFSVSQTALILRMLIEKSLEE